MILIYQSRDKRKRGKVNVKNIDVLRTIYDKNTYFFLYFTLYSVQRRCHFETR